MNQIVRRRALLGTASALFVGMLGTAQAQPQAAQKDKDPDLSEILFRISRDKKRGESLSNTPKYAALLACATAQALSGMAEMIATEAIRKGVDPVAVKEAVYQCAPYVGLGKVLQTIEGVNKALNRAGVRLPLNSQKSVSDADRRKKGEEVVLSLNGARMREILSKVPEDEFELRVNDLYEFCFGDFYTRGGLSLKDRELVVFTAIATLGGCEAQLRSHIGANLRQGTNKAELVEVLRVILPYLGFPRTLNALNQIDLVTQERK